MNLFCITVEQANATMRGGIEMTVDVFVLCCWITNTKTTLWSVQMENHNLFYDLGPECSDVR